MQSDGILMAYKGAASSDVVSGLLAVSQTKLAEVEHKSVIKKKVFSILVEVLQNILNHYENVDAENFGEEDAFIFILAKTEDGYNIISGNHIANEYINNLKNRIEEVNSLTPDELKEKYRNVLDNGTFSKKGGAGLGIIDIAKKSGNKLTYEFIPHNDQYSFFSLIVKITAI